MKHLLQNKTTETQNPSSPVAIRPRPVKALCMGGFFASLVMAGVLGACGDASVDSAEQGAGLDPDQNQAVQSGQEPLTIDLSSWFKRRPRPDAGTPSPEAGTGTSPEAGTGTSPEAGTPAADAGTAPTTPGPMPINCVHTGSGREFNVGDGQAYPTVGAVPWESLAAGDTVRIHWRSTPYKEKIFISGHGTEAQPIRVCGVAGPQGQLPVLDGAGATTRPQLNFRYDDLERFGTIVMWYGPNDDWATGRPTNIKIEGLEIRGANSANTFRNTKGQELNYFIGAASISIYRGQNITIRGCTLTDSGNGFFVVSKSDNDASLVRNILFEGNHVYGNGYVNVDQEHNIYTESAGITFQYNWIGRMKTGAGGAALKDRSAGTIIRYNRIEGGARSLDLVEPQDSYDLMIQEPNVHEAYVYGNVIRTNANQDLNVNMIHYGGDVAVLGPNNCPHCRKGTLYFYHNSVIVEADQTGPQGRWRTALFDVSTSDETVDMRNNIVLVKSIHADQPATAFSLMRDSGVANVYTNLLPPGWFRSNEEAGGWGTFLGSVNVMNPSQLITGTDAGFDSLTNDIPKLRADSVCVGKSTTLATSAQSRYPVQFQYKQEQSGAARLSTRDLGASEH